MLESNLLTLYVLPAYLMLIMIGMGMTLVPADFSRVVRVPKAAVIGLVGQIIAVPLIAFLFAKFVVQDPVLSVGFMILGACPGGITSNLIVYLARGDLALSIMLTGISSVVTVLTIPLVVGFSLLYFLGADTSVHMPVFKTIAQVFGITVLPISIGMIIRAKAPQFAEEVKGGLEILLVSFLVLLITVIVFMEWDLISSNLLTIGFSLLLLNMLTLALGFAVSWLAGLNRRQSIAIGVELGIQNGTLGMVVAISVLGSLPMAIPSGLYAVVMLLGAAAVAIVSSRFSDVEENALTETPVK